MSNNKIDTNKVRAIIKEQPDSLLPIEYCRVDNDCYILYSSLLDYFKKCYSYSKSNNIDTFIIEVFGKLLSGKDLGDDFKKTAIVILDFNNEKYVSASNILDVLRGWVKSKTIFLDKKEDLLYLAEIFLFLQEESNKI